MKKLAVLTAVGLLTLPAIANAQLTLNFDMDKVGSVHTYSGVGVADDSGTVWNSVAVDGSASGDVTVTGALDSEGNSTSVNLVMNRNGGESLKIGYYTDGGSPNPSDLMSDYVYWDTWYVTLSGLAAGTYDLYGMGHGNAIDQTCTFTWGSESASTTQDLADYRDIFQANAEGNTYVKLSGTVDGSGVLAFTASAGFNGFQLQMVPEPSSFALAGFGLLSLVFARRRR